MTRERIHFEKITQEQAKRFNDSILKPIGGYLLDIKNQNAELDLGPTEPPIFPSSPMNATVFHYMEHTNEEDPTDPFTYWVVSISWPKSLFSKNRHVLVLKAVRSDENGNEIPMDNDKLN